MRKVKFLAHGALFHAGILISIIFPGDRAKAQWILTGQNLLANNLNEGALSFSDGVVWAARDSIWKSVDSGKSWNYTGFVIPKLSSGQQDLVEDMCFRDILHGILTTEFGEALYRTSNGGITWDTINIGFFSGVCYDGTENDILVGTMGSIGSTTDGGQTWSYFRIPFSGVSIEEIVSNQPGVAYGVSYTGAILKTNDFGKNWFVTGSAPGINNLAMDSCSPTTLYYARGYDSIAFVSLDDGGTWDTLLNLAGSIKLSGAIVRGENTIYCQTMNNGIYRSTDVGKSWVNIGGPSNQAASEPLDVDYLTLIDDNTIIAGDYGGNLFSTFNSGGYPVPGEAHVMLSMGGQFVTSHGLETDVIVTLTNSQVRRADSMCLTVFFDSSILHFQNIRSSLDQDSLLNFKGESIQICNSDIDSNLTSYVLDTLIFTSGILSSTTTISSSAIFLDNRVNTCSNNDLIINLNPNCADSIILASMEDKPLFSIESIVPNPASSGFRVSGTGFREGMGIEIFDVLGQSRVIPPADVRSGASPQLDWGSLQLDVSSLPAGTYYLRLSENGYVETRRVEIER